MISFLIGLFIGATFGVFAMALVAAGSIKESKERKHKDDKN